MINDYSTRCYSPAQSGRPWHSVARTPAPQTAELLRRPSLLKAVGVMVLLALLTGLTSTLWYSRQIESTLDEIGNNRQLHHELVAENRQLTAVRQALFNRENIVAEARKLDLYPPTKKQVHRL